MKDDDLTKLVDIYAGDHLLDDEASSKPLDLDALQKAPEGEHRREFGRAGPRAAVRRRDQCLYRRCARRVAAQTGHQSFQRGDAKVVKAADGNFFEERGAVLERPKPVEVDDSLSVVVEFGDGTAERIVGKQLNFPALLVPPPRRSSGARSAPSPRA